MSTPTVQKALKGLEDKRLIAILKFDEKTNNSFPNNIYSIFYPIIEEEEEIYNIPQLTEEQIKQLEDIEKGIYNIKENEEEEE